MEEVPTVIRCWMEKLRVQKTIHLFKTCPRQCICAVVTTQAKIVSGKDVSPNLLTAYPSCIPGVQPLQFDGNTFSLSPSGGIITKLQGQLSKSNNHPESRCQKLIPEVRTALRGHTIPWHFYYAQRHIYKLNLNVEISGK